MTSSGASRCTLVPSSPASADSTTDSLKHDAGAMGVRRLTPTECERLQGLPDGHTCGCGGTDEYRALLQLVWDAALAQNIPEREARGLVLLCQEEVLRHALLLSDEERRRPANGGRRQEARAAALSLIAMHGLRINEEADRPPSHRRQPAEQRAGEHRAPVLKLPRDETLARGLAGRTGGAADDRASRPPDWSNQLPGLAAFCNCADSPRYAALGDAVTANVAEWIGRRIIGAQ